MVALGRRGSHTHAGRALWGACRPWHDQGRQAGRAAQDACCICTVPARSRSLVPGSVPAQQLLPGSTARPHPQSPAAGCAGRRRQAQGGGKPRRERRPGQAAAAEHGRGTKLSRGASALATPTCCCTAERVWQPGRRASCPRCPTRLPLRPPQLGQRCGRGAVCRATLSTAGCRLQRHVDAQRAVLTAEMEAFQVCGSPAAMQRPPCRSGPLWAAAWPPGTRQARWLTRPPQASKRKLADDLATRRRQVHDAVHAAHQHQRQLTGDAYRWGPTPFRCCLPRRLRAPARDGLARAATQVGARRVAADLGGLAAQHPGAGSIPAVQPRRPGPSQAGRCAC